MSQWRNNAGSGFESSSRDENGVVFGSLTQTWTSYTLRINWFRPIQIVSYVLYPRRGCYFWLKLCYHKHLRRVTSNPSCGWVITINDYNLYIDKYQNYTSICIRLYVHIRIPWQIGVLFFYVGVRSHWRSISFPRGSPIILHYCQSTWHYQLRDVN